MTSSEVWDEDTATRYDASSAEMFEPEVLDPAVDFLADLARSSAGAAGSGAGLAGSGAALEFAVGTGRVAIPLAERGVAVTGIDLSEPMAAQLRQKVDGTTVPVVLGDMATTKVPGTFDLVYLVFNSISNLRTQAEQVECFRNAAHHLKPGGRFVIELWIPAIRRMPPGQRAVPMTLGDDGHLIFDTYDLATQACTSHHYYTAADGTTRYGAGNFRYIWPAECDLMAQLAGMELEARYADWHRTPFTSDSESHISIWQKP